MGSPPSPSRSSVLSATFLLPPRLKAKHSGTWATAHQLHTSGRTFRVEGNVSFLLVSAPMSPNCWACRMCFLFFLVDILPFLILLLRTFSFPSSPFSRSHLPSSLRCASCQRYCWRCLRFLRCLKAVLQSAALFVKLFVGQAGRALRVSSSPPMFSSVLPE